MFTGSSGSISRTVCTSSTAFLSKSKLKRVVAECLKLPSKEQLHDHVIGTASHCHTRDICSSTTYSTQLHVTCILKTAVCHLHTRGTCVTTTFSMHLRVTCTLEGSTRYRHTRGICVTSARSGHLCDTCTLEASARHLHARDICVTPARSRRL